MPDINKITSGNQIVYQAGTLHLPATGNKVFRPNGIINIHSIENKYSGQFLPNTGA